MASYEKIRYRLVQQNDETLLPDAVLDVFIADATDQASAPDATSIELYACYLIAQSWQSLGQVTREDGVTIKVPNPQHYLDSFNKHVNKTTQKGVGIKKVSVDQRYKYSSNGITLERR